MILGDDRISLLTRLNSRFKPTWAQVWRQALVDCYAKLAGDEIAGKLVNDPMQALLDAEMKRITYIMKGQSAVKRDLLRGQFAVEPDLLIWYFLYNPLKLPEFILTLLTYSLDRLCLIGLSTTPNSQYRAQKLGWPRFLLRGLVSMIMSLPLFITRAIGSPLNTLAMPFLFLAVRIFNFQPGDGSLTAKLFNELTVWLLILPFVELYLIGSVMIPALINGVPLFSAAMISVIFGGTGLALVCGILALFSFPFVIPFVLSYSGYQPRPSDALYREENLNHAGPDIATRAAYEQSLQELEAIDEPLMEELEDTYESTYEKFLSDMADFDELVDDALDSIPRRYEPPRPQDNLLKQRLEQSFKKLSLSYHPDKQQHNKAFYEGAQKIINFEKGIYPAYNDRFFQLPQDQNDQPGKEAVVYQQDYQQRQNLDFD